MGAGDKSIAVQQPGDPLVQPFHAPGAAAQGAEQLELAVGVEHRPRPLVECLLAGIRRRAFLDDLQVVPVAERAEHVAAAPAVDHQVAQHAGVPRIHADPRQIGVTVLPHRLQRRHVAGVHRLGELADAAVGAEAVAVAEHGDRLVQRRAGLVEQRGVDAFAGDLLQPVAGRRPVVAFAGAAAQFAEHRAGFHRGELVLVAEQDQPGARRQRGEQRGHHFQVDHGRLVHHQQVQRQRVAGVMAELAAVRAAAEQAVQGGDFGGDDLARRLAIGQCGKIETIHRPGDGFVQPRRRLAGGRGQADAQRPAAVERQALQQRQQAHHRGGLAGAGAAGDDAEGVAGHQCAGQLLPVGGRIRPRREQRVQRLAQRRFRQRAAQFLAALQTRVDAGAHVAFVLPVAAQVEAPAGQHQRRIAGAVANQPRIAQRSLPTGEIDGIEQHAGQGRRILLVLPFRRQRQGEAAVGQGRGKVEADVPATELVTGQRGGEDQQRIGVRRLFDEEGGEGAVQFAQPAARGPLTEQVEHFPCVHAGTSFPGVTARNSASSSSISSLGGFSQCRPWVAAWLPRRNR
ncbi:hypothetical protein D9M68_473040 [compost metagenome]